jgi:tRNA(fMet)-specific endonuclease VapC
MVRAAYVGRRERRKVESLLGAVPALVFDAESADRTAAIRADLEASGQGIGPYDTMLAGQAMAAGLTMVTSNRGEFGRIKGLRCLDWRRPDAR